MRWLAPVLGVLALSLLIAWSTGALSGLDAADDGPGEDDALIDAESLSGELDEAERVAALRGRAERRRMPGMDLVEGGQGLLRGTIVRQLPGGATQPVVGVEVEVLVLKDDEPLRFTMQSGSDGVFSRSDAPALFGYELLVRHAPFKTKRLLGVSVQAARVTDVGTIILGASSSLSGEVRTAEGGPPAGAVVQVLRDVSRSDSFDIQQGLFELQAGRDALAEVEVDRDGAFTVDDLPPGRYVLRVAAPGYATAFRGGARVTVAEASTAPRVILDRGTGFEGVVRDDAGQPVPNAHVIAVATPGRRTRRVDREDTKADASGRYRFDSLTPGVRYFVETWADGFAPTGGFHMTRDTVQTLDWTLRASGRVEGRITDRLSGDGVPGAQVTVVAGLLTRLSPVSTVTDDQGRFELAHVNAGPVVQFGVVAPGYQQLGEVALGGVNKMRVVAGETLVIDQALEAGGAVAGRVLDADGDAIGGATISLLDSRKRWAGEQTAVSEPDGAYEVTGLWPGTYELRVTAPGYAPPVEDADAQVQVEAVGETLTRDITLLRGAIVFGVVVDPTGIPVASAQVRVQTTAGGKLAERVRDLVAVTDSQGAYRLHGVPAALSVTLICTHDAFVAGQSAQLRLAAGATQEVPLALRPGLTLAGTVEDERGRPLEGARVRWGNVDGVSARRLRDAFGADEHLGPRVVRTDATGAFVLPNLEPGTTLIKVEHVGYGAWYRRDFQVVGEGEQRPLEVILQGALSVSGRVVSDTSGVPVGEAIVYVREEGAADGEPQDPGKVRSLVSGQTDVQGRFTLDGLPPGSYEVVLWLAPGYVAAAENWRADGVRMRGVAAGASGIEFRGKRAQTDDE